MAAVARSGGSGLRTDADIALATTAGWPLPREEPVGQYNKIGPFTSAEALAAGAMAVSATDVFVWQSRY